MNKGISEALELDLTTRHAVTPQSAGAFGEWAVVVELLRRGWTPANVNQTVKNNKGVDILAQKGNRSVSLSVKTRRPNAPHWQIGGFIRGDHIQLLPENDSAFTILVGMAVSREDDEFYVVPSHSVREECQLVQEIYMATLTRAGHRRIDIGHWNLISAPVNCEVSANGKRYGNLKERWKNHLDNWQSLERAEAM
jgi:hypothetical protein